MMKDWWFYKLATGIFTGQGCGGSEAWAEAHTPPGCGMSCDVTDWRTQRFDAALGCLVDYTPPAPAIGALASSKWEEMKVARAAEIAAALVTPYGTFDHDPRAVEAIARQGAISQATGVGITFTLADNTSVELTAEQMVAVWVASHDREQAAMERGRVVREAIEAAASAEALAAIVW